MRNLVPVKVTSRRLGDVSENDIIYHIIIVEIFVIWLKLGREDSPKNEIFHYAMLRSEIA